MRFKGEAKSIDIQCIIFNNARVIAKLAGITDILEKTVLQTDSSRHTSRITNNSVSANFPGIGTRGTGSLWATSASQSHQNDCKSSSPRSKSTQEPPELVEAPPPILIKQCKSTEKDA